MLKQLPVVVFDWPGVYYFTDMHTFIRCNEHGVPAIEMPSCYPAVYVPPITPPNPQRHVVIVIGCGKPSQASGTMSSECALRAQQGVSTLLELLQQHLETHETEDRGRPPCIVLSGGFGEAAVMANLVRDLLAEKSRKGSEKEQEILCSLYPDVLLQELSRDTVENGQVSGIHTAVVTSSTCAQMCTRMFSRRLFDRGPLATRIHIHLITSNYHSPRATMVFQCLFNSVGVEVHAVPVQESGWCTRSIIRVQQALVEANADRYDIFFPTLNVLRNLQAPALRMFCS
jgi:hypothetical protein